LNKEIISKQTKEKVKDLIRRLHEGEDPEKVKEDFKEIVRNLSPLEISIIEGELVKEGMPRTELQTFCDAHLAVFRESIEKDELKLPDGHPINILMQEHKHMLDFTENLREAVTKLKNQGDFDSNNETIKDIDHIIKHLIESESHYLREENVLFPYLEKHGVTEPPAVMWMEHDKIRDAKKQLQNLRSKLSELSPKEFTEKLSELAILLSDLLSNHFYKENKILFPTALKVIEEQEWGEIREQFDDIGYCCFTPQPAKLELKAQKPTVKEEKEEGVIKLETGTLTFEEVEGIFNALPVEVTFVDKNDIVRYFIPSKHMVFLRTKAVIGNKVQNCHPQKSIHIVNKILDAFRKGERDSADFWINFKGRFLYIRYFPVRSKTGEYLGCIEVTQDVTEIRKLEGEKRLLDWS